MKKYIRVFIMCMFVFVIVNTSIYANESGVEIKKVPYSEKYEEWLKLPDEIKEKAIEPQKYDVDESFIDSLNNDSSIREKSILRNTSLPSYYNTLDEMEIKVKNQKTRNICWAFAFTSYAEIACKKYENESYEFSPMHLDYGCTRSFKDRINPYAEYREYNTGGGINNIINYLTSGQGPILEEYMPFDTNKGNINYSDMPKTLPSKFIDFQELPGISTEKKVEICNGTRDYSFEELKLRENIKKKIVQSGGVWCALAMDKFTKRNDPVLYSYQLCDTLGHAVVLIGYDDNYSADNFSDNEALRPKHNGAYIAINSYGNEWGNNGVFYISYDDVNVESRVGYIKNISDVDYDSIYQHNFGDSILFYEFNLDNSMPKQLFTANIFERDISKREELTKLYIPNTSGVSLQDAEIEVYINSQNSNLNTTDLIKVDCDVTNLNQQEQYINLKNPVELNGEKYAVVIKYILKNENNSIRIALENTAPDLEQIIENQSFYSFDGEQWNDLYNFDYYNQSPITTNGAGGGGAITNSHYAIKIKALTKSLDKNLEIIDIKSKNSDLIYSDIQDEILAYVNTTANLNGTSLSVNLLKDDEDVTDKIEVISIPDVKSRASNIKFKIKDKLDEGKYKLKVTSSENLISEKEFFVSNIESDERFVKLEYEDEKFIDALKKSIPELNYNIQGDNNKNLYVKKEYADSITNLTISSKDDDNIITSIKGIEVFQNLSYLSLFKINVEDIDSISSLPNLQYLYVSNSNIEKEEVDLNNTRLTRLSMYNCDLYDISKLHIPNSIISIDLENNHIRSIPNELYNKARYISVLNQTIYDEVTLEQNENEYVLLEIPEILKLKSPQELVFTNCEYDENSGKIKISTKNIGEAIAEIELPLQNDNYDIDVINPYGSKYTIKYNVVEKNVEPVEYNTDVNNVEKEDINNNIEEKTNNDTEKLNPKTGTKIIYIYGLVVLSCIVFVITLKQKNVTNSK